MTIIKGKNTFAIDKCKVPRKQNENDSYYKAIRHINLM